MSMPRITWDELPAAARAAVVEHTGPVHAATSALNGVNSGIAARLQTGTGDVFIKGVPADHPQIRTQQREADINLHLPATCPRLLWRVRVSGWDLLGFELLAGRTADFAPGSADLPKVVAALHTLTHTPCPDLPLKRVDQRWAAYAHSDALPLLDGDHLLHTDMAPRNILIADHAHLIDWAWPTEARPGLTRRSGSSGSSTPATPLPRPRTGLPAWRTAPPAAVAAFAHANVAMWNEIAAQDPTISWKKQLAASAHRWSEHRASIARPPTRAPEIG
ncbi:MAG: hypothetical protein ACRDRH_16425 [Pseudonocardia sp.]